MARLKERGRESYQVVLIGTFTDDSEEDFFSKAKQWGVSERIEFHRWMEPEAAQAIVSECHVGLVLFQAQLKNNVLGLPHKMFDYMAAGLPVIAPDFAPDIADVLAPAKAGELIDTSNPSHLAEVMERLMDDPDRAAQLGANGRSAVSERFNWDHDAATLIAMYAELLGPPT
jgi:glycosyltransferase involved in cell wall biosynthesis